MSNDEAATTSAGAAHTTERRNLTVAEAVDAVLALVTPLAVENVHINSACGRALSSDVTSSIDIPRWDNAGMDGYAVQRADVLGATTERPVELPVIGSIAAGHASEIVVNRGACARIMTGAPVPAGADAVVRIEDTNGDVARVRIVNDRDVQATSGNVRRQGEDVKAGALVFERGTSLTPAHIAVLASIGYAHVPVHRIPRVILLSSGDELATVEQFDQVERGERIVASSSYALPAALLETGANVRVMPLVPDTLPSFVGAMREALDIGCDLLLTTGGVSVGAHDYTRDAIRELGGEVAFWRARIRPGGPVAAGKVRDVPWIGLPGNPVSTMVTAELFARPAVRVMAGHRTPHAVPVTVRLAETVKTSRLLAHFLRAIVKPAEDGQLEARLTGGQGSNLMRTLAEANALLVVPEGQDGAPAGSMLKALLLGGQPLVATHHAWLS